jgi:hypothetical protein
MVEAGTGTTVIWGSTYGGLNLGTRLATDCCKEAFGRKAPSGPSPLESTQSSC